MNCCEDADGVAGERRGPTRRQMLTGAGGLAAGGVIAVGAPGATASASARRRSAAQGSPPPPLRFFTDAEAETVAAMAERVFPADAESPGARDAGVLYYIDGRLAGAWGNGKRFYLRGPFEEPQDSGHGYQLPLLPRDLYRRVLAKIDAHCRKTYGGRAFTNLSAARQDEVLTALQDGQIDLDLGGAPNGFTSVSFFTMFLDNVTEGLFSDPMHGGNRDMIGWRWVGFPGDPSAYGEPYAYYFEHWHEPYNVAPKGVQ